MSIAATLQPEVTPAAAAAPIDAAATTADAAAAATTTDAAATGSNSGLLHAEEAPQEHGDSAHASAPAPVPAPALPVTAFPPSASASLYVGELHPDVSESMLFELFNQVGPVSSIRVCRDAVTRRSLGYAYVNFHNVLDGERALDTLNYTPIKNQACRIMWSQRDPTLRRNGSGNIFIKNLDKSIDNKALHDTFSAFGNILSCKVVHDESGSKGFGYVHYETREAAEQSIAKVNGMLLNDKKVFVGMHVPRRERASKLEDAKARFTNVYVKNISEHVTDEDLNALFSVYGDITSAIIQRDDAGKSKGFGFVNFVEHADASRAVSELHERDVQGQALYVCRAQSKSEREEELRRQYEAARQERITKYQGINLYVKNLAENVDEDKLSAEFVPFGSLTSCKVMRDDKGVSKGFGFVCMSTPEEASKALAELNGKMFENKPIYVAIAQRKEDRKSVLEAQHANRTQYKARQMPMPIYYPGQQPAMFMNGGGRPMPGFMPQGMPPPMMYPGGMGAYRGPRFGPPFARPSNGHHHQHHHMMLPPSMLPPPMPGMVAPGGGGVPLPGAVAMPPSSPTASSAAAAATGAAAVPPPASGMLHDVSGMPPPPTMLPNGMLMHHGPPGSAAAGMMMGPGGNGNPGMLRGMGGRAYRGRGPSGGAAGAYGFRQPMPMPMPYPGQPQQGHVQMPMMVAPGAGAMPGPMTMLPPQGASTQPGQGMPMPPQSQMMPLGSQQQQQQQQQSGMSRRTAYMMHAGGSGGFRGQPSMMPRYPQQGAGGSSGMMHHHMMNGGGPNMMALTAASLAAAPSNVQKQILGERLFPLVAARESELATKITGMLLDMDNGEILHLLESPASLSAKIAEAVTLLQQLAAGEANNTSSDGATHVQDPSPVSAA